MQDGIDYGMAGLPRPIEVQVFEAWYLAEYPEKVNPEANIVGLRRIFPDLAVLSYDRQHVRLRDVIRKAGCNKHGQAASANSIDLTRNIPLYAR